MPRKNIGKAKADFSVEAKSFFNEYNKDEKASRLKYDNKVIQISGTIKNIKDENGKVTVFIEDPMSGITCAMDSLFIVQNMNTIKQLKAEAKATIKGKCDGFSYDPDMADVMGKSVILSECVIVNN